MFTLQDMRTMEKKVGNPTAHKLRANQQKKIEKQLVSQFSQCSIPKDRIKQNISNLNIPNLDKEVKNNFYNPNVISAIACISEKLITVSPEWEEHIQSYLTNLKRIGAVSNVGTAYFSDLTNPATRQTTKNLFVIKVAKDNDSEDDILHEAMIGMLFLNKLRSKIPNFAYIYGFFKCGKPDTDNAGNVSSWCDPFESNGYVIYENIPNSISFYDSIQYGMNSEQFLIYLVQFLLALKLANRECNFTHFDCHPNNVLLRKLNEKVCIKYDDNVYIVTDTIVTFIDYGMSYCDGYIDNNFVQLGNSYNWEYLDIFNDKSFIIHDVFKFIGGCLITKKFQIIEDVLLSYFIIREYNMSYNKTLDEMYNYYFSTPYNEKTKNFNIDHFLTYIKSIMNMKGWRYPIISQPNNQVKSFSCDLDICKSLDQVISELGL